MSLNPDDGPGPTDGPDPLDSLDAIDRCLIEEQARGRSVTQAAARAGVSSATAYRRMDNPVYRLGLAEALAGRFRPHAVKSRRFSNESLDELHAIVKDPLARPADKIAAARVLLDSALKVDDYVNLKHRLAAMEVQLVRLAKGGAEARP